MERLNPDRFALGDLYAALALAGVVAVCFVRLIAEPGALIVDGRRPSLDHARRDEPRAIGNDLTFTYLPHHRLVAGSIARNGKLAGWDPNGFAGRPMVGNPQGGLFYPPVWLAWWSRSPAALGWITLSHLFVGGLGLYALARSLLLGRFASTIAAGCFQANPYVLSHVFEGHYPHVWTACWYPWAFLAFDRQRRGDRRGLIALPPILAVAFLAGHAQEWYYLIVALSAWAAIDAIGSVHRGGVRDAAPPILRWGLCVALAIGLAAVEIVPDLLAQRGALASGKLGLGRISHYELRASNLFQLVWPRALGGPHDYFGRDNLWESLLAFGMVPLFFLVLAAATASRARQRPAWIILVAAPAVFAAGRRLPLFPLCFALIPGMERFRVPSRSLFLAAVGAAILTGFGVDRLATRVGLTLSNWRRLAIRTWLALGVILVGLVLLSEGAIDARGGQPRGETAEGRRFAVRPVASQPRTRLVKVPAAESLAARRILHDREFWLVAATGLLILTTGCLGGVDRRRAGLALGILALLELGLHGFQLIQVAPAGDFLGPDPISGVLARARADAPLPSRIRARDSLYHDLRAFEHGYEKVNISDSFQLQRSADLYETLYAILASVPPADPGEMMGAAVEMYRHDVRQGVLDRLGVAYLVSDRIEPESSWPLIESGLWKGRRYAVHRNPTALPRAYVVPRAEVAPGDVDETLSRFRRVDPREVVLMAGDPLPVGGPRQPFTPAHYDSGDPDRVVVRVRTEHPGLLVVADTWAPGWSATVDGHATPIAVGNHAQRVVPLPAGGDHRVVLSYRVPGFTLGRILSATSFLIWIACLTAGPARRRHPGVMATPNRAVS